MPQGTKEASSERAELRLADGAAHGRSRRAANTIWCLGDRVSIPVNRRVRNGEGRLEDRLDGYFGCQTWREEAEIAAKVLRKGTAVRVIGILLQKRWQDGEGNSRSRILVQADEVYVPLGIANLAET
ncbi:MAG: single-stranded DNA-binding protein [Actinomycetota bacterium]